jgi:metallophosphoesterase (TIGR00282 family)
MNILCVGDVTSPAGVEHLRANLWQFRRDNKIDFCVVNGENASLVSAATPEQAETLLKSGADAVTGGNHTLRQKLIYRMLEENNALLRPINFPEGAPGVGYNIFDVNGYRVLLINAMGNVHIDPTLDSPYPYIDRVLSREEGRYDIALIEIHAEATGEKVALGYAYDGKVSAVWGTHTHVPTADEQILPLGTGYITDIGMCGESGGVLGMDPALVVERMRTRLPIRFQKAAGRVIAGGVIFTVDEKTRKTTSVRRVSF